MGWIDVGIVIGMWAGHSEDRIPMDARFSAPGKTDPGAHSASCTMGIGSRSGGRGVAVITHPT